MLFVFCRDITRRAKAGASAQRSKAGSSGRAAAPTSSEVSSAEGKAAGLTREGKQQNGSGDDSGNAKSTEKSDKDMLPDGAAVGEGGSSSDKEAIAAMEKKRREDFGKLTDLADSMLHAGQHDVYHQTREELEESAAAAAEASAVRASTAGEEEKCYMKGSFKNVLTGERASPDMS